jgi:hypothetical protein
LTRALLCGIQLRRLARLDTGEDPGIRRDASAWQDTKLMSTGFEAPRLARPGAGLPAPELLFSQWLLAFVRATSSRASAWRRFLREARRICRLVGPLEDGVGGRQMLVPRLMGLEDSSRFWSPFMVFKHLIIVDSNMFRIMTDLVAGRPHPDEARIENFKPSPTAGRACLAVFEQLVAEFAAIVPKWPNLHTQCRPQKR